jgi:hypothetical protein
VSSYENSVVKFGEADRNSIKETSTEDEQTAVSKSDTDAVESSRLRNMWNENVAGSFRLSIKASTLYHGVPTFCN